METETQHRVAAISRFQATKQKADRLLAQNKITVKDLEELNQFEREYFNETCTQTLQNLSGLERDKFLDKVSLIISPNTNAGVWEQNHASISIAIADYIQQYGSMPAKSFIAEQTGLSRQTVTKHFATYKSQPEFIAQMEQFQFMSPKVLANVMRKAIKGDIKAARLYFEMVGNPNQQANLKVMGDQNNYIQINNTILSQDNLKQLSMEQLEQIESIVNRKRA